MEDNGSLGIEVMWDGWGGCGGGLGWIPGNPLLEFGSCICRGGLRRRRHGIRRTLSVPRTNPSAKSTKDKTRGLRGIQGLTTYVSHILMTFRTVNSLMSKQFIHRKLNWMNSMPCSLRWFARGASMRVISSRRVETILWIPGWAKM
jgi:hypothetical protein